MNVATVIDVALGLSLTFFTLSLIASALQEIIAGVFTWRGTYLSKGLDVILDNSKTASFAWVDFRDFLRAHLTSNPGITAAQVLQAKLDRKEVPDSTQNQALQQVLDVHTHPLIRSTPSTLPSYIPARNFSLAMLEVLRDGSKSPVFSQAERTIAALPEGDLRKTLAVFLQDAEGDLDKFRSHLELWFDDAMDRVGGIYRRLTQYVMISLGLILAISLNVNTIFIAQTLSREPELRAALVDAASKVQAPTATDSTAPPDQLKSAMAQLDGLGLPIGWDFSGAPETLAGATANGPIRPTPSLPGRLLGWIITAIAVSLGAPFWFDLLQNIVNLRAAGAKPNRSDDPRAPGANR